MSTALIAPPGAPHPRDWSPWGAIDAVEVIADGVVFVSTPSHGGVWLSAEAQLRMPEAIKPMHGRQWFEEDCEIWAPIVVFRAHSPESTRSAAIMLLARWMPGWLDALAAQEGLPTTAQVARIRDLHSQIVKSGQPDLETWRRGPSGTIEGWIGGVWFTIAACGEAVG
jgi:hypothetical protein